MPEAGASSDAVYQIIKDELDLDGRPNLNLASFVNTYMDPYADRLMAENMSKNLADADEYPVVQAIHARCISMLGNLWNIPKGETAIGTATTGSSEAIHLGGLAMKRCWQNARRAQGKSTDKPNIIMGANAQVALEKYARPFVSSLLVFLRPKPSRLSEISLVPITLSKLIRAAAPLSMTAP